MNRRAKAETLLLGAIAILVQYVTYMRFKYSSLTEIELFLKIIGIN